MLKKHKQKRKNYRAWFYPKKKIWKRQKIYFTVLYKEQKKITSTSFYKEKKIFREGT